LIGKAATNPSDTNSQESFFFEGSGFNTDWERSNLNFTKTFLAWANFFRVNAEYIESASLIGQNHNVRCYLLFFTPITWTG